ncbi:MAG: hypothetical protein AAGH99_08285 [Planctomycetota bacterium]
MSDPGASPRPGGALNQPAALVAAGAVMFSFFVWVTHQGGLVSSVPGSTNSLVGLAVIVLEALPLLAAWWLGAAGYGYALRQRGVAQLGVGMAFLLLLNYVAGFAVGFSGIISWGICLAGVALLAVKLVVERRAADQPEQASSQTERPKYWSWWWLLGVPGLAVLVVAACCPPGTMWRIEALGYDVTSYHLQIPREWVAAGKMTELEHNVYAYLPGLMESAFASLMTMRRGLFPGASPEVVYVCQLFHASFAVLAAAAVASLLRRFGSAGAAAAGGGLILLAPWVVVTGSLAYNEMVVVAFAAVGLRLVAGENCPCGRTGVAIGLLAGAATLAKLTAAFTVALPLGVVLVWRLLKDRPGWSAVTPVVLCVVVGFAALSPYLVRNAAWTGNPVFPFAGSVFGYAHWDEARADRWDAAHMPDAPWGERISAVWRQAIGNTGYGAWGGQPTPTETKNIARFANEGGLPVLWIAAAVGLALGFARRTTRWFTAVLLALLLGQFVWWLVMTHLQSRFLVVAIVPLCAAVGLFSESLRRWKIGTSLNAGGLAAGVVAAVLAVVTLTTTWSQTTVLTTPDGQRVPAPLWFLVDGLPEPYGNNAMADFALNDLPAGSRVMVVGNNQSLFYVEPDMVYASAFDESPITPLLPSDDDPQALADALRAAGVTHLWIGYSELDRLHATYGFDAGVTTERLSRLVVDWSHLGPRKSPTVLVEVP